MKLYRISQNVNNEYDTYSDAVVCAEDEESARNTYPGGGFARWIPEDWANPDDVKVEYLGEAAEGMVPGVICASYHAG